MSKIITYKVGSKPTRPSILQRLLVLARAKTNGFSTYTIPNQSMSPTLGARSLVPLEKDAYHNTKIGRGDIVVFRSEKHAGVLLPSRAVGLPGETIKLSFGQLIVGDEVLPEPYIEADNAEQPFSANFGPIAIPESSVFLLGDFRDLSEDSRSIGPVPIELIVGRIHI